MYKRQMGARGPTQLSKQYVYVRIYSQNLRGFTNSAKEAELPPAATPALPQAPAPAARRAPHRSRKTEALCAAPPEALTHSPSLMPLSCPVAHQAARS